MAVPQEHRPGDPDDRVAWKRVVVYRRTAWYAVAGPEDGIPTLFLHGWALAHLAYREALRRLARLGCRVWAPALPGFGGTAELSARHFSFDGFAELGRRVRRRGGHRPSRPSSSATRSAGEWPSGMRTTTPTGCAPSCSSTRSAARSGARVRSMAERPLWDWGLHFPSDVLPVRQLRRVVPVILEDAVPNLVRNPRAVWRVAQLARKADLTPELEELKRRALPVAVLWGDQDEVIPRSSFDALCTAIGATGEVVHGTHSWLLADPDRFGEVMTNVVEVARVARSLEQPGRPHPHRLRSLHDARPHDEQPGQNAT